MLDNKEEHIRNLRKVIEYTVDRKIRTPKDFDYLGQIIYNKLRFYISSTTLKRIWGYLKERTDTRVAILDALSRFVGYRDWDNFCQDFTEIEDSDQELVIVKDTLYSKSLQDGQMLDNHWYPNRTCRLQYIGKELFKVIDSTTGRLSKGDTFQCSLFIEGEPLYLSRFLHEENPPVVFVLGRRGGIVFSVVDEFSMDFFSE